MFTLVLSPDSWQEGTFISQHHVHSKTGDGKVHLILKGAVSLKRFKRQKNTLWAPMRLILKIPLRQALPKNHKFQIEQWAPQIMLSGLSHDNDTSNFGYEIRWTKLRNPPNTPTNEIHIEAEIAVRDNNSHIQQLNYSIDLVGSFTALNKE